MEEQNGDHERRTSEEDVGDLLLGVDEVLGNSAIPKREEQTIPKKNGKGNEDEVHHVPAPSLTFHLERKPISCPGTPLDVQPHQRFSMPIKRDDNNTGNQCIFEEGGVWRESIAPARRLKLAAVKGNHRRREVLAAT